MKDSHRISISHRDFRPAAKLRIREFWRERRHAVIGILICKIANAAGQADSLRPNEPQRNREFGEGGTPGDLRILAKSVCVAVQNTDPVT